MGFCFLVFKLEAKWSNWHSLIFSVILRMSLTQVTLFLLYFVIYYYIYILLLLYTQVHYYYYWVEKCLINSHTSSLYVWLILSIQSSQALTYVANSQFSSPAQLDNKSFLIRRTKKMFYRCSMINSDFTADDGYICYQKCRT